MSLLLTAALALSSSAYYTSPTHPGRHYDCAKPGTVVEYENDQVVFLCGGLTETTTRSFWKGKVVHWQVADPSKLLVKSTGPLSQAEVDATALAQLQAPFYDSSEKRMVRIMGTGLALDAVTTLAFGFGGACHEAMPVPGLGLAVAGYSFMHTRRGARKSARYFTWSHDKLAYTAGATHAAAGLHNLFTCT